MAEVYLGGVHDRIAEQALRDPARAAVVADGDSVAYEELQQRANRLAQYLRGVGVRPDSVVGLCLPRGVDLVVAMVAVWKAGAAYLPLDPGYPAERLAFMMADTGMSALVGHRAVAGGSVPDTPMGWSPESVPGDAVAVWLDDPATVARIADCPDAPPAVAVEPAGLACVIYTSGSTGQPKASLVPHESLLAVYAGWSRAHFPTDAGYRWLSLASASFDVFTGDVVRALCSGGTLVLGEPGAQLDPGGFARLLAGAGIEALECAPQYVDGLVEFVAGSEVPLPQLRLLVVTTEVWRVPAAVRARQVLGSGVRLLTAYGVTEATIDSTYSDLAGLVDGDGPVPIGGPLPGSRLRLLDGYLNPVPVGVVGEVFLGGPTVTRGYGGNPDLTAQRFVADPFAGDGSRLYRTGDLARWRPDGQVEFLGRADTQVKVRGFRVEPGEVEHVLTTHPDVSAAVVIADQQQRLLAYLVPTDPATGTPAADELRRLLRERLPEFMIPALFIELTTLPLTPNGKIDRAALPAPDATRPDTGEIYVAPSGMAQELLAGIWAELLGLEQVGAHDNFFELGGHSLLATQVV
ncbi:amino acid adenylation domain-containing protein, partial [Plantactinospora solaniradicis]